ncbi:MAG: glycoside hydrolase family 27 protein [Marinilabiliales bacterium]|nr:glycoside hydrolase family 27 protein [Marinilabiliales bacterium]
MKRFRFDPFSRHVPIVRLITPKERDMTKPTITRIGPHGGPRPGRSGRLRRPGRPPPKSRPRPAAAAARRASWRPRRPWASTPGTSSAATSTRTLIRQTADALVETGMRDAGYQYLVIDDCWQVEPRRRRRAIVADPQRFAGGMKALADYVHSKGLLFGLYTDIGPKTCAGRPASAGYFDIDAVTYAEWGVDYIKVDWCNCDDLDAPTEYAQFRDALRRGRPAHRPEHLRVGPERPLEVGPGRRPALADDGRHRRQLGERRLDHRRQLPARRRRPAPAAGTTPTCSRSATAA